MKSFIQIPKPCTEDWNSMTPTEFGRHCKICNKSVIDFTQKTDDEIKAYFQNLKGKSTCGYYHTSQVELPINTTFINKLNLFVSAKIRINSIQAAVLFLIGLFTATSCNSFTKGAKAETMGDTVYVPHTQNDTINN